MHGYRSHYQLRPYVGQDQRSSYNTHYTCAECQGAAYCSTENPCYFWVYVMHVQQGIVFLFAVSVCRKQ